MPVERKSGTHPPPDDSETLLTTKEQILTLWRTLPDEHQATMAASLLDDVMNEEYRLWFQIVIANRWPLTTEQLETTYPLIELSELDLRRAHLDEVDIPRLTPAHRHTIAQTMRLHYIHDLFWPELRHVADMLLDNLDNPTT